MTPQRLTYLASRAAAGEQTNDEQRECMEELRQLHLDLASAFQYPPPRQFTGQSQLVKNHKELAAAAKLPELDETPQRKRCEACGGSGSRGDALDTISGLQLRCSCKSCDGSGYISEDQK